MNIKEIRDTKNKNIRLTVTPTETRVKFPEGSPYTMMDIMPCIVKVIAQYTYSECAITLRGELELKFGKESGKSTWCFKAKSNDRFLWREITNE